MENRFQPNGPGSPGWNAQANPQTTHTPPAMQTQSQLCAWVCEKLPELLENDGTLRPEMAAGIHAHLAVCLFCAQEYDTLQQVVYLVEKAPLMEMPRDYSDLIMRRILQPQNAPPKRTLNPQDAQSLASPSVQNDVSETTRPTIKITTTRPIENDMRHRAVTASPVPQGLVTPPQPGPKTQAVPALMTQSVASSQNVAPQTLQSLQTSTQTALQTSAHTTQGNLLQRFLAGSLLSSVLTYFVSSAWGRQMLGVNVAATTTWMEQLAETLRGVPVLTWIVGLVFSALAQVSGMLEQTYRTLGVAATYGVALDIAVCTVAYAFLNTRRQRAQMQL